MLEAKLWRKRLSLGATIFWCLATAPLQMIAQAELPRTVVVSFDMGGSLQARQTEIRRMRQRGQRVEILGRCYSACTMYLGLPNVCVGPDAVLGFHGPRGAFGTLPQDAFEHWSRIMSRSLRQPLQTWFMMQARYVAQGTLFVSGAKLIEMGYVRC